MNYFRIKTLLSAARRTAWLLPLLAWFSLQSAGPNDVGRWLLIFDTSVSMKKLQPSTVAAAKDFFSTSAEGQLQPGESVAVWTVSRQVTSQFPPFDWSPDQAGIAASNLASFLQGQAYATPSQLAALQSPLNRIAAGSRQLSVVIFTDGQSDLSGTPYDEGINQTFREHRAERSKSTQLFMLVLRSDRGKFIGCTMNFPPGAMSLPPFPPQPAITNKPVPVVIQHSSPASQATNSGLASLVIVGSSVSTNGSKPVESFVPKSVVPSATNAAPAAPAKVTSAPTTPPAATNPPVVLAQLVLTNLPAPLAKPAVTNPLVVAVQTMIPPMVATVTSTPLPAVPTNSSRTNVPQAATTTAPPASLASTTPPAPSRMIFWVLGGVGALVLAGVIAAFVLRRRPQSSLISASMTDEDRPRR